MRVALMAGPVDEEFAERHLRPGSVLEFGCSPGVFTSRIAQRPDLDVTGVDLYPAEAMDGYRFVQGDVLDVDVGGPFDSVLCVSSFEHVGIETRDFSPDAPEIPPDYPLRVADRLRSLVRPGGRLVLTCPFGVDEVWLTHDGGDDFPQGAPPKPEGVRVKWGYRTYSLRTLTTLFMPLRVVLAEAYEHTGGDYFDIDNWRPVDAASAHVRYRCPHRRAVLGVVFEKGSTP